MFCFHLLNFSTVTEAHPYKLSYSSVCLSVYAVCVISSLYFNIEIALS